MLTADIDLKGSTDNLWTPINAENNVFIEFDGGNHTISNLYVNNIDPQKGDVPGYQYGGLFYVLQSTIKDLTIEVANVTCLRGGVLVGRMDCGTLENCHVKNTTVTSIQKVAGLVGFVSSSAKDVTIRNCSVDQCKLNTPNTDGIYQAGGLIGYLQSFDRNVLIEGNSVSGPSKRYMLRQILLKTNFMIWNNVIHMPLSEQLPTTQQMLTLTTHTLSSYATIRWLNR